MNRRLVFKLVLFVSQSAFAVVAPTEPAGCPDCPGRTDYVFSQSCSSPFAEHIDAHRSARWAAR